jgi:hypothetical protein
MSRMLKLPTSWLEMAEDMVNRSSVSRMRILIGRQPDLSTACTERSNKLQLDGQ